ncbi:MAG: DUF4824 family protein [Gammaproteobacteria bacterium]|nr:DUF4824 family protein [Gammaproteobacteria bacterium]
MIAVTSWSHKRTLIVGLALLVVTNAVALIGVAYNRLGEPESQLRLTERELALPYSYWYNRENSGLGLTLTWRAVDPDDAGALYYSAAPKWLDKAKLATLGFDVSSAERTLSGERHYRKLLSKNVWVVLELDGPAYRRVVEHAKQKAQKDAALAAANPRNDEFKQRARASQESLVREQRDASRLIAIDAGLDVAALRERYPNRAQNAIVSGRVTPSFAKTDDRAYVVAYLALNLDAVHVPLAHRRLFDALRSVDIPNQGGPRYEVTAAFGQRLEPWIVSVAPLNSAALKRAK